jgi:UDP-N-acetylmuramyl pentapeptide synthase
MKLSVAYDFREAARMLGAIRTIGEGSVITSVETDSRLVRPGSLFVALAGSVCDGSRYLPQAKAAGAAAAVVSQHHVDQTVVSVGLPLIIVDDSLKALWKFSHAICPGFPGSPMPASPVLVEKAPPRGAFRHPVPTGRTVKTPGKP